MEKLLSWWDVKDKLTAVKFINEQSLVLPIGLSDDGRMCFDTFGNEDPCEHMCICANNPKVRARAVNWFIATVLGSCSNEINIVCIDGGVFKLNMWTRAARVLTTDRVFNITPVEGVVSLTNALSALYNRLITSEPVAPTLLILHDIHNYVENFTMEMRRLLGKVIKEASAKHVHILYTIPNVKYQGAVEMTATDSILWDIIQASEQRDEGDAREYGTNVLHNITENGTVILTRFPTITRDAVDYILRTMVK